MKVKVPKAHEIRNMALIKFNITDKGTIWDHVPPHKRQWEEHNIAYAVTLPQIFNLNLYMTK